MHEVVIAESWLVQKLTGSSSLTALINQRVYGYVAPKAPTFPYVTYRLLPDAETRNVLAVGGGIIMANMVYAVEATDNLNNYDRSGPIAELIDSILHKTSGVVTGGSVISCVRISPLAGVEIDEAAGIFYRSIGSIFIIKAQKSGG